MIRTNSGLRFSDIEDVTLGPVEWDLALMGGDAIAGYNNAAQERGLRVTHPDVQM